MVRNPLFAGRSDATATNDENGDGVVDARDDAIATEKIDERGERRLVRGRRDGTADVPVTVDRTPGEPVVNDRSGVATVEDPAATGRFSPVEDPATTGRLTPVAPVETAPAERERAEAELADDTEPTVVRGPRPRASLFATLGLIFGLVAAAAVLTGMLAKVGLALAVIGALLSLGGFSATSRRHVAGRFDAVLGFILSAAAIVLGILAVTNSLSWLSVDTDTIPAVRDWLHQQWHALTS